jgi:hypothetical protein
MVCNGWTLVMLGMMAKNMPTATAEKAAMTT